MVSAGLQQQQQWAVGGANNARIKLHNLHNPLKVHLRATELRREREREKENVIIIKKCEQKIVEKKKRNIISFRILRAPPPLPMPSAKLDCQ